MRHLALWVFVTVSFAAADAAWLSLMKSVLYQPALGSNLRANVEWSAVLAFYAIYTVAVVVLAIRPGASPWSLWQATGAGALLGLAAYATYDLSNQATLNFWQWRLTLIDITWGVVATALVSYLGWLVWGAIGDR
jgi:uncharacterized membrane protein